MVFAKYVMNLVQFVGKVFECNEFHPVNLKFALFARHITQTSPSNERESTALIILF